MRNRIASVDVVRGIVMVIMALDHVRDYFSISRFDPTDLQQTTPGLFFTRWITHFCAPVFVFLAGTSAFFYGQRQSSTGQLSKFLLTRGLVLVILEITLVRFALLFNFDYSFVLLMVIWVIGLSMIIMAALVYLPLRVIGIFGVLLIVGHNALDSITPQSFGSLGWLWAVLHVQNLIPVSQNLQVFIVYPLIPWVGVMAAGYAFGSIYLLEPDRRRKSLLLLGIICTLGFILIRGLNIYGDPRPWTEQKNGFYTFLSFLNANKYPPSLSYLLMTIGPAIILLSLLEKGIGKAGNFFMVYGKVPMFYYILHFLLLHALAVLAGVMMGFNARDFLQFGIFFPPEYGYPLWGVYLWWIGIVLALYPVCKWYGDLKRRSSNPLLSYI